MQGKGHGEIWQDITFNVEKAASMQFHLRLDLDRLDRLVDYAMELGTSGRTASWRASG
jgi:hypothetical protein